MRSNVFLKKMPRAISISLLAAVIGMTTVTSSAAAAQPAMQAAKSAPRAQRPPRKTKVTREMISEAQQRLADLGYWIGEADGKWGEASRHGLIAFQKVEDRLRTGKLTIGELEALRTATPPSPREPGFAHIEVDLKRQVLFVVAASGEVSKILPVSTGNGKPFEIEGETEPAITPVGRFRIYRKIPGWRKSKLGLLYYPNYIVGGIAIHGNPAVPTQPASHGCIRIPMFASEEFSEMTPIGTQVIIYGGSTPEP
ncbi:MAG: L,D-transpeptidase family protein [Acidobacteriota bacterium]